MVSGNGQKCSGQGMVDKLNDTVRRDIMGLEFFNKSKKIMEQLY